MAEPELFRLVRLSVQGFHLVTIMEHWRAPKLDQMKIRD